MLLQMQRHSSRFRLGNPRAAATPTMSGYNLAAGSQQNQPRYPHSYRQHSPPVMPQPRQQGLNQPTPQWSIPQFITQICFDVNHLCGNPRAGQGLSWVANRSREMVHAIYKSMQLAPWSEQQIDIVKNPLYRLARVLQDINGRAAIPGQQGILHENFLETENLMAQVLKYARALGQQQTMNDQQPLLMQQLQQQPQQPQLPQQVPHQSQQIHHTHVVERSNIEVGPDGRRMQRSFKQVTSEIVEPMVEPMDMSQPGPQSPQLRVQHHDQQQQQHVQDRLQMQQQYQQSQIGQQQPQGQPQQRPQPEEQQNRHSLPQQVARQQQQQQPQIQRQNTAESQGPDSGMYLFNAVRRMHQEAAPRPPTPTGPSPPPPPPPYPLSRTSPRPQVSPSSLTSPRALMSPPAYPARSMVSPPVRSQAASPRQQASSRPNSRSSSVDETETSNDAICDAGRLIDTLRSAALRFRNMKFKRDMNKMMAEKPYELLEIAVEKYKFELPKGITMERARAVFTKQNVVRCGGVNSISSPGMLRNFDCLRADSFMRARLLVWSWSLLISHYFLFGYFNFDSLHCSRKIIIFNHRRVPVHPDASSNATTTPKAISSSSNVSNSDPNLTARGDGSPRSTSERDR